MYYTVIKMEQSQSHFWNCLTLKNDCPFLYSNNQGLWYYGYSILALYATFIITVLLDLKFMWTVEGFMLQVDNCVSGVRNMLGKLTDDSIASLGKKYKQQIQKSKECIRVVQVLREAASSPHPHRLNELLNSNAKSINFDKNPWFIDSTYIDEM